MNADAIESLGYILKEESLQNVDHYTLKNTLVLENLEPFPGYHGVNLPLDAKPDSIFLITDKAYPVETVFRISQQMCHYLNFPFDSCPAEIFIYNTQLFGIRIKGLSNYSLISDIQGCYMDHNIHFMKKRQINDPGLIRINKIFCLEKLAEYVYKDLEDERTFYLSIPYYLNWNLFKKVTIMVKNNLDNSNFDCAVGFIYRKMMLDFVRIYTQNIDINRLQLIRSKYLEEVSRLQEK
jgi:hypothetical protein